jgi:hypothetical protein
MIRPMDVLKSPSVWTGKDGVTAVTDLLKNPPLQDKIQLGLMKSSFDTLVKTGEIVTPGTDLKKPSGQLYDAAANAGKNLISASAGLVAAPKALSSLPTGSLSNLDGELNKANAAINEGLNRAPGVIGGEFNKVSGAISGALGGASGALGSATEALGGASGAISGALGGASGGLNSITSGMPNVSSLANRGTAELGGLLANASKFGVDNAVSWAKGSAGAVGAASAAGSQALGVNELRLANAGISPGATGAASGLKTQMDSLAKQGQFAVNFSDFKLPAAVAGIVPAAGFKGTVDRSTLNAATAKLVGSNKIALPNFSPQAVDTSALTDAANEAKGLLSSGLDATGALSKAKGALGAASGALGAPGGIPGVDALGGLTGGLSTANINSRINALGDPKAPPYTGDDPIIRARLGLPPVRAAQ